KDRRNRAARDVALPRATGRRARVCRPRDRDETAARRRDPPRRGGGGTGPAGELGDRSTWRASGGADDARDGGGQAAPRLFLGAELVPAARGQLVVLRAAIVLRGAPAGLDPAAALEAMQRRVQRPLLNAQRLARALLDALGDGPAVLRLERERVQDQQIQ